MKKIILIFLIVLGLFVFNITQASAGCNIVWTGDLSGSIPTNETSRTQQAAQELFRVLIRIAIVTTVICRSETPSFTIIVTQYSEVVSVCSNGEAYVLQERGDFICEFSWTCMWVVV